MHAPTPAPLAQRPPTRANPSYAPAKLLTDVGSPSSSTRPPRDGCGATRPAPSSRAQSHAEGADSPPAGDGRGRSLLGIVTDRDIRLNPPSQATSLSVWEVNHLLAKLTVGEVMTKSVILGGPDRPARDAARLMVDHPIGALPVEDTGRLVGIITETDLLRAFIRMETPFGAARLSNFWRAGHERAGARRGR